MPTRKPLTLPYPRGLPKLASMKQALADSSKKPSIGLTQGGSSRKARGAKVAATNGQVRQH
jgi:hypothetical protein